MYFSNSIIILKYLINKYIGFLHTQTAITFKLQDLESFKLQLLSFIFIRQVSSFPVSYLPYLTSYYYNTLHTVTCRKIHISYFCRVE